MRFRDKSIHWKYAISMIITNVSLSSNKTYDTFNSSIRYFKILKKFRINIHPFKAPSIIEVLLHPPLVNWMKCNTDAVAPQLHQPMVEFLEIT
jgi:hypothetical protein